MRVNIVPGLNVFKVNGREYFSIGLKERAGKPGIVGVLVDPCFNIISEQAYIPGRGIFELLNTQQTLEDYDKAFNQNSFNAFLVNGGQGGAGHNAIVWPFANRHNGEVIKTGDMEEVKITFDGKEILIPANWPPASGWSGEPSRAIHGFGYRLENRIRLVDINKEKESVEVVGNVNLQNQWFSSFSVTHRILIQNGILTREVTASNIGEEIAPFACGEHPDFAIPEEQLRSRILLKIPARKMVKVNPKTMLPDFSENPFIPVLYSHLAELFHSRDREGFFSLDKSFIDNCFVDFISSSLYPQGVKAQIIFPDAGFQIGVFGEISDDKMINALQVYAPLEHRLIALEFQGNVPDPFNQEWNKYEDLRQSANCLTNSGMRIIKPRKKVVWRVFHEVNVVK